MIINVLDPSRTRIRGLTYSARSEFIHIQSSHLKNRPPKDINSLYPFYESLNKSDSTFNGILVEPIIIDDNISMWPADQQDHIIVSSIFTLFCSN